MITKEEIESLFYVKDDNFIYKNNIAKYKKGSIAGNERNYITIKGIQYKKSDLFKILDGTYTNIKKEIVFKERINQDNPENYFIKGTKENTYLEKMISKQIGKYSYLKMSEDLRQEAYYGALNAKKNYIMDGQALFSTYLYHYISGYIKNYVKKEHFDRKDEITSENYEIMINNIEDDQDCFDNIFHDLPKIKFSEREQTAINKYNAGIIKEFPKNVRQSLWVKINNIKEQN
jgi:hypothetical protein